MAQKIMFFMILAFTSNANASDSPIAAMTDRGIQYDHLPYQWAVDPNRSQENTDAPQAVSVDNANSLSLFENLALEIGFKNRPLAIMTGDNSSQSVQAYRVEIMSARRPPVRFANLGAVKAISVRFTLYSDATAQTVIYSTNGELYVDYKDQLVSENQSRELECKILKITQSPNDCK